MNPIERERRAVACLMALEAKGLRIEIVSDPERAARMLDTTGRTYSTFPLDPKRVAFTRRNASWIFAMLDGDVYAGCGVRIDDLGDEGFDEYFRRTSLPTFGEEMIPASVVFPGYAIHGKAAYWGDMISPRRRAKGFGDFATLRLFCYYAQHRVFTDFGADVSYCFMQDKMFVRGAPQAYGFLSSLPFVWDWESVPYPAGKPDWVSFTKKEDLDLLGFGIGKLLFDNGAID